MSANKFENQVQQKMDELRLQPTAQVWEEVERRIRERKRRRMIVFWFLFAGLLLSGGAWWMLNTQSENKITVVNEKKDLMKNDDRNEIIKPGEQNKQKEIVKADQTTTLNDQITKTETSRPQNPFIIETKKEQKTFVRINKPVSGPDQKNQENITTKTKVNDAAGSKDNIAVPAALKDEKEKANEQNEVITSKPDITQEIVAAEKEKKEQKDTVSTNITDAVQPASPRKSQQKNKWETSLLFAIGNTRLTNGNISAFGAKSMDAAYSSPNTSTGGSNAPISYADSIPLKGTNLQLGISAKRKLGKKTSFSAGLNFSYYSTKQRTGVFKDSMLTVNNDLRSQTSGGFYRAGTINTYHNKYYYLQVPVLFHWQINKGDKLPPLNWENGFAPSFLLASDALVYDRNTHIFYKDKRVFNSFSLVYQTALSARLFKDTKHPLGMGIYYNYHLSQLQKVSPPNYNYLSAYGVRLNWIIKK